MSEENWWKVIGFIIYQVVAIMASYLIGRIHQMKTVNKNWRKALEEAKEKFGQKM